MSAEVLIHINSSFSQDARMAVRREATIGPLVVHPCVDAYAFRDNPRWTVAHEASGFACARRRTKRAALKIARALAAADIPWERIPTDGSARRWFLRRPRLVARAKEAIAKAEGK